MVSAHGEQIANHSKRSEATASAQRAALPLSAESGAPAVD